MRTFNLSSRAQPATPPATLPGECLLITRDTADKAPEGPPFFFSPLFVIRLYFRARQALPCAVDERRVWIRPRNRRSLRHLAANRTRSPVANLSKTAREYMAKLRLKDPTATRPNSSGFTSCHWLFAAYLSENADGIRRDCRVFLCPIAARRLKNRPSWASKWPRCWTRKPPCARHRQPRGSTLQDPGSTLKAGGGELAPTRATWPLPQAGGTRARKTPPCRARGASWRDPTRRSNSTRSPTPRRRRSFRRHKPGLAGPGYARCVLECPRLLEERARERMEYFIGGIRSSRSGCRIASTNCWAAR